MGDESRSTDRAKELCGLGSPVLYKEMVVSETKEKDLRIVYIVV